MSFWCLIHEKLETFIVSNTCLSFTSFGINLEMIDISKSVNSECNSYQKLTVIYLSHKTKDSKYRINIMISLWSDSEKLLNFHRSKKLFAIFDKYQIKEQIN